MSVSGPEKATPMLAPTVARAAAPRSTGRSSSARMRSSTCCTPAVVDRAVQQHGELVAAQAGGGVGGADGLVQPLREDLEQQVAGLVAVGVVDRLEAVEVDVEHRGPLAVAAGQVQVVLGAVEEERPVGQLGQRVVHRRVPELLLQLDDPAQVGLQAAAVQGRRDVAGEGLQQGQVAAGERADVAEPAGDQQQPLHAALGDRAPTPWRP